MSTPTMRGLARLVLEDRDGDLGRAAAIALARVVLEGSGDSAFAKAKGIREGRELEIVALGPRGVAGVVQEPGGATAGHSSVDDNDDAIRRQQ